MKNPKVDLVISKDSKWENEVEKLRTILLDCSLTEELKWDSPCYLYNKKNIILIHSFKDYCAISFFNGALLSDPNGLLIKPGKNTQAGRQIRFTNVSEILKLEPLLKAYIYEAIEVEKAGLKVEPLNNAEITIPEELQLKLNAIPALKEAFEKLTPGRQRVYNMYFSEPKQSKTRETRIEKYMERILIGKGFNDCVCGLSQKMPSCDGSHKYLKK